MKLLLHRHIAPLALAFCFGAGSVHAADSIDFAAKVLPILTAKCVKCHGADKQSAKLRLDSAEEITKTGKKTLLVAGKPDESELFKRVSLPADDKKRMPKGGDPLSADEIALIKEWITQGGSLGAAATPAKDEATAKTDEHPAPRPAAEDDPELAALPKAPADAIAKIEATGATVMPLFADSPLLQVSFAQAASPPNDDAIASLAGAADQIVWLNLKGAQVSAAGIAPLAKLKNLIQLHLEGSNVDDKGLAVLSGAKRLEYLNLYGTTVTDAALEPLRGLPHLRNLYVWKTKVSYDAAQALEAAIPGLEVNVGWDNTAVVKKRLAKELESAKEAAQAAANRAQEVELQLKSAKEAREAADTRVKEIVEQLKALEAPTTPAADAAPGDAAPAAEPPKKDEAAK